MEKRLQVIDWNFCYQGYNKKKLELLFSLADEHSCIMLQEIMPEVYDYVRKTYGDRYDFVYSLDHRKPGLFDTNARKLGVLIACGKGVEIVASGVVDRCLFPDRTAWAVLRYCGEEIRLLALHSLTGCGYNKAKSIQYDTLCEFMEEFAPDIVGIDANEPRVDSCDIDKMEFYENGYGASAFFHSVKRKGLVDAFVKGNGITEYEEGTCLATSHVVRGKGEVRYDFLFVKGTASVSRCAYLYDEAINAGGDHAIIVAEIIF